MNAHQPAPKPVGKTALRLFGFRTRLYLTWLVLLLLFVGFFLSFDLNFAIIVDKFPNLAGFKLGPNGFLQGAALTLFLCLCSMLVSVLLGLPQRWRDCRQARCCLAWPVSTRRSSAARRC